MNKDDGGPRWTPSEIAKLHAATHALMGLDPCGCPECEFAIAWRQTVVALALEEVKHDPA